MTTIKRTVALVALLAVMLLAAPALAGPQNGEVNHVGKLGGHRACSGSLPEQSWWEDILDHPLVAQMLEYMPLEVLFPDAGDLDG